MRTLDMKYLSEYFYFYPFQARQGSLLSSRPAAAPPPSSEGGGERRQTRQLTFKAPYSIVISLIYHWKVVRGMTVIGFGRAFKTAAIWVKNVNLTRVCGDFGLLRDNCAHFRRIECLSPHILAAWQSGLHVLLTRVFKRMPGYFHAQI